jgi:hypothetical protein
MQRTALALCSLAISALALVQDAAPPSAAPLFQEPGNPMEPPERMRVEVGDEVLVFDVGGEARLADGRTVRAAFEPTRHLVIDGSFALDYPRAWKFIGLHGLPEPVDAWWSLNGATSGAGGALYLRRHGQDAAAIVLEYAKNLEASGWSGRHELELELDGRRLAGLGFDIEMGSFDGQPATRQTQEVFGWQERDGVAWLFVVTTLHGPVDPNVQIAFEALEKLREQQPAAPAEPTRVPICTFVPELAALIESLRFERR